MEYLSEEHICQLDDKYQRLQDIDIHELKNRLNGINIQIHQLNKHNIGNILNEINLIQDMIDELYLDINDKQFKYIDYYDLCDFKNKLRSYEHKLTIKCSELKSVKINNNTFLDYLYGYVM